MMTKGLLFGLVGGVVGAMAWAAIIYLTGYEVRYVALGIGLLVGIGVGIGAQNASGMQSGILAVIIAIAAICLGKWSAVVIRINEEIGESAQYIQDSGFLNSFSGLDLIFFALGGFTAFKVGAGMANE